jgi:hypothetical protein
VCFISCKLTVDSLQCFLDYILIHPEASGHISLFFFFFLDEKETKNQDLGFSAIKMGSLPKTQKLARSYTHELKQFKFLNGPETSGSPFCPDASGRLPNPMVGEVFGGALIVVGPDASGL